MATFVSNSNEVKTNLYFIRLRENNEKIGKFAVDLTTLQVETEMKLHITNRETAELIEAAGFRRSIF